MGVEDDGKKKSKPGTRRRGLDGVSSKQQAYRADYRGVSGLGNASGKRMDGWMYG